MDVYLWSYVVGAVLLGWAGALFSRCWRARGRVWVALKALDVALAARRTASAEWAASVRAFRPDDAPLVAALDKAREAAVSAEPDAPPERRDPENAFTAALSKLLSAADADPLLVHHARCRAAREKLAESRKAVAGALDEYNRAVGEYRARSARFPVNVILHVLDLADPDHFAFELE
jgi:hypothetical protein